jgi:hypothetical protein
VLVFILVVLAVCSFAGLVVGGMIGGEDGAFMGAVGAAVGAFVGFFIGGIIVSIPTSYYQTHYNERTISCKVTGKDRGGKDDGMRIYTSCGVFENTDSYWRNKHNSADLWAKVKPGETQQFHVVGWRFPLMSDFPNVLEVK